MSRVLTSLAGLALSCLPAWCQLPQVCSSPARYTPCDFVFDLEPAEAKAHPDPYLTLRMHAEFRSPRHRTFMMPAYWDGGNRMVIRFSPPDPGEWTYRITSDIARFNDKEGTFTAADNESPGFVRVANVHHWAYTERNTPHLWMGDTAYSFLSLDDAQAGQWVSSRAEQKFNHLRFRIFGDAADPVKPYLTPDRPNPDFFRRADQRFRALQAKAITADVILGSAAGDLVKRFPRPQQRERFIRYIASRYSAFDVTWHLLESFEQYPEGRALAKELGERMKSVDPYNHPRSCGADMTSSPLLPDGWMNFVQYGSADPHLGAVEHQFFQVPFVTPALGPDLNPRIDLDAFRRRLWNATMNGQYPTLTTASPDSPAAKTMTFWYNFFADTRHWELEPYFDVSGGRGIALEGIEYIIYVEKPNGPVEVQVEKHGYDVSWVNPATGESVPLKKFKAEQFVGEAPSRDHDWILHIEREGKKEGMLRSYKFDSRPIPIQEIESNTSKVPFEIAQPANNEISMSKPPKFALKITRQTRATRRFDVVWTGEVVTEGQGVRILGTGTEGTLIIPRDLATKLPAVLSLRVSALNANGKAYSVDRVYQLVP